ncbi:MAG TPA: hypothetical protein VN442_00730 [Bryobacteraceae bacterium]|nr:hypothetical protein [Bryobacteraceae bacterium]
MTSEWIVDEAQPEDAPAIARLLGTVLPSRLNDLSIWSSPKLSRYLAGLIESRHADSERRIFVLRGPQDLVGAASMKDFGADLWMDNIHVVPDFRKKMLANEFIVEVLERCLVLRPVEYVGWDSYTGDPRLDAWHKRLGGVEQSRTGWHTLSLDGFEFQPHILPSQVEGMAEADERHAEWGFSSFAVHTSKGCYTIGRLPAPYFRIIDVAAARDLELLRILCTLDRSRKVLLLGPEELGDAGWLRVAVSRREKALIRPLMRRLRAMVAMSGRAQ